LNAKSVTDCKCDAGYVNAAFSNPVNWFYVDASSWTDAKAKCEQGSGNLASIHDAQEMTASAAVCSTTPCFIGMYRSSPSDRWRWVDGSSVSYYAWDLTQDQPKGKGDAVAFFNNRGDHWRVISSSENLKYRGICKKKDVPPQCVEGLNPKQLGMRPGFHTQIYHLGSSLSIFPKNRVQSRIPDAEGTQRYIQDYNRYSFYDVDRYMPNDYIAGLWYGAIIVKQSGTYTFYTQSDDGSNLYVDGRQVVANDGLHGPLKREGSIFLNQGVHFVKAEFFQNGGGIQMLVRYRGPDTQNREVYVPAYHFAKSFPVAKSDRIVSLQNRDYATLSQTRMGTSNQCPRRCQTRYLSVPNGWEIAPNNAISKSIISNHWWETDCVILSDGSSWWTRRWSRGGQFCGNNVLQRDSYGRVRTNSCNRQILIVRSNKVDFPTIEFEGFKYATLGGSKVCPDKTCYSTCQQSSLQIPDGWQIAINDAKSIYVASMYGWETDGVVLADGSAYGTKFSQNRGELISKNMLKSYGSSYQPVSCNLQVLIRHREGLLPDPSNLGLRSGFHGRYWHFSQGIGTIPAYVENVKPNTEDSLLAIDFSNYGNGKKPLDTPFPQTNFVAIWTGIIAVRAEGTYTFQTSSDDGSNVYVNGDLVVNNGGLHGIRTVDGQVRLPVGYHYVKIDFFNAGGPYQIVVKWKGPHDSSFQLLGAFHHASISS